MGQTGILRRGEATPASGRASQLCGALVGVAVTGVYFIGAGRAYGLDASVTVHRFVATSSLLACVVSTVLLPDLRRSAGSRLKDAGYVVALATGIAIHLYGLAMLPIHAAIVGARPAELRRWLARWVVAAALGLLAYVGIAG